jgi:hypothetical protein
MFLDNNPAEAKFLTPEERSWAIERLRDNNTGVESSEFFGLLALGNDVAEV